MQVNSFVMDLCRLYDHSVRVTFDLMFAPLCPCCLQSVSKFQFVMTVEGILQYLCVMEYSSEGDISASKDGL